MAAKDRLLAAGSRRDRSLNRSATDRRVYLPDAASRSCLVETFRRSVGRSFARLGGKQIRSQLDRRLDTCSNTQARRSGPPLQQPNRHASFCVIYQSAETNTSGEFTLRLQRDDRSNRSQPELGWLHLFNDWSLQPS